MSTQRGFTLIELLVVVAIIGVLGALGITSFSVYRSDAAYANVQRSVRDLHIAAQAGTLDSENLPPLVALVSQDTQGPMVDAGAREFLVGFQVSPRTKVQVSYDPNCATNACLSGWAQVNHCNGQQYMQWLLYGDGSYDTIENIAGVGCP